MNISTQRLYRKNCSDAWYETARGAKATATKMNTAANNIVWVAMDRNTFENNYNPMVTVKNILSGKEVQIRRSERGGCTDPSTERFHCM
jgi:hypothetical protein